MGRSKSHKKDEDLLGQVRALKSEVRNLRKQLKYYEKREHMLENIELQVIEEPEDVKITYCHHCKKGILSYLDLGIRAYYICSMCSYRKLINEKS